MHGGTWNFTEQEQGMIAKRIGEIKVKQVSDLETVLLLEGGNLKRVLKERTLVWTLIKDKLDMESIAHLNSKNVSADVYPDPGTYVPPTLHYLLDNSNSDFAINDYVALLLYEEEENSTGQFIDPVYIYAKVVNCINNSQNLSVNCDIAQFDKRRRSLALKSKDVVLTDNAVHSPNLQTVDESLKEVKEHFIKILKITDETKRRLLIRRLRAKWHPDQNFGNEERATQVFKFIESLIRDLKDGKIIDEEFNRQSRYKGEDIPRSPYFAPPPQNSPNSFSSHNRFAHGVNREKVPIPRIARKWLRQAKCDRQAAEALYPHASHIPAFNWTCYHCHQALWLGVVGHHTRMRYPDQISGDDIPSTVYSQQDADQCFRIASDIISFVSQRVQ
ncbi:SACS [Mytilus edulis]|uniref:SACS n=1 Tax=Mytilus edulis TaxID=6550 RepID=A0A8S3T7Y9_MYTED|nr:SACS [Mytilus edulis]